MKVSSSGALVLDLAKEYRISPDGLDYTFVLKDEAVFQDGTPVTADDVVFTIKEAQDPNLKSPRRAKLEGVTAEKVNDKTVDIKLKTPILHFLKTQQWESCLRIFGKR